MLDLCGDVLIRGEWIDAFLIYWVSSIMLYFLITYIVFRLPPWAYELDAYPTILVRSLLLPIIMPLRLIAAYRGKKAMERYARQSKDKPGPKDGGAPTGV